MELQYFHSTSKPSMNKYWEMKQKGILESHHHFENHTFELNSLIFDSWSVKVQCLVRLSSVSSEFQGLKVKSALTSRKTAVVDSEHHWKHPFQPSTIICQDFWVPGKRLCPYRRFSVKLSWTLDMFPLHVSLPINWPVLITSYWRHYNYKGYMKTAAILNLLQRLSFKSRFYVPKQLVLAMLSLSIP